MIQNRHFLTVVALCCTCLPGALAATDGVSEIQMVLILGETYVMGNHLPKRDRKHHEDEPTLRVTVRDFRIGKTRVTSAQFCEFLNSRSGQHRNSASSLYYVGRIGRYDYTSVVFLPDRKAYVPKKGEESSPANQVTWEGAVEFCRWLSEKTGKTYRLPTEAEWELAARREADGLNMCKGIAGEWCINRWNANPQAKDMTDSALHFDDLSSERAIRGQRKWQKSPLIPFPLSNNSMHGPSPWTRRHRRPQDIKSAAWYGFRVVQEIEEQEKPNKAIDSNGR